MKQMALTLMDAESQGWPILEPIDVDELPRPVAINKDVCVVGSRPEVNLKLSSPLVSRTHAMFVADHDSIYLRDLASRNHTYLNEKPIREALLRDGDVITLGKLSFRCKSGFDRPYDPTEVHAPAAELRPAAQGKRIPLNTRNSRSTLIGSREDCDVVVKGKDVEPSHAVVFEREGHRYIRDLRTVSGTWVNDEAVGQIELNPGDEIRIADARFVYELSGQAEHDESAELPLANEPVAVAAPAEADPLNIDDEHVDLELADETAERIPESVGLSDWDAADLISEPQPAAAVPDDEKEPAAEDFRTDAAVREEPKFESAAASFGDDEVIPIRLDDLSQPEDVPPGGDNNLAASQPEPDLATAAPADVQAISGEHPRIPRPKDPIEIASVAPEKGDESEPKHLPTFEDEPVQNLPSAAEDPLEPRIAINEAASADVAPEPSSRPDPHPGEQNRVAPEEKLTELLDHLANDLEEVRSTWGEVQSKHAGRPGDDYPGTASQEPPHEAGASPDDEGPGASRKGHAAEASHGNAESAGEL